MSDVPFASDDEIQAYVDGTGDPRKRTPLPPFAPSVVEKNPGMFKQEVRNYERPQPWSRGVEETISPTLNAYGMGQMAAEGVLAAREGDYGTAAANAILIGMPGLKRLEGAGMRKATDWGGSGRLQAAQEMRKAGATPEQVWREHGWSDNAYGQPMAWHTAIDDGPAKPAPMWGKSGANVKTQYDHPELYAAYPEIGNVGLNTTVGSAADDVSGRTVLNKPHNKRDYMNQFGGFPKEPFGINVEGFSREQAVPVLTHELQHGVSVFEPEIPQGTTRGALPNRYDTPDARNWQAAIDRATDPAEKTKAEQGLQNSGMWAAYLNQLGEVIARGESAIKARKMPKETPRQHSEVDTFDLQDHVPGIKLDHHKAD